jgi:hypothetical protein
MIARSPVVVFVAVIVWAVPAYSRVHAVMGGQRFSGVTPRHTAEHGIGFFIMNAESRHGVPRGSKAILKLSCSIVLPADVLPKTVDCSGSFFFIVDVKTGASQMVWGDTTPNRLSHMTGTVTFLRVGRSNRWHIRGTFSGSLAPSSLPPSTHASSPLEITRGHFSVTAYDVGPGAEGD